MIGALAVVSFVLVGDARRLGGTAPSISSIIGADAMPTAGGTTVSIVGENFGTLNSAVSALIGFNGLKDFDEYVEVPNCTVTRANIEMQCESIAGAGTLLPWKVVIEGQESLEWIGNTSYKAPDIIDIIVDVQNETKLSTKGGDFVRIVGSNFGPMEIRSMNCYRNLCYRSYASAKYGPTGSEYDVPCDLIKSHTTIECKAAEGVGKDHRWVIHVGYQFSKLSSATSSYKPPHISSLGGSVVNEPILTAGGQQIIFTGSNFGVDASTFLARFGPTGSELLCRDDSGMSTCKMIVPHEVVECITPPGTGQHLGWVVEVEGQHSGAPVGSTAYGPPVIYAIHDAYGRPVNHPTYGDERVIIKGFNFGPASVTQLVFDAIYGMGDTAYMAETGKLDAVTYKSCDWQGGCLQYNASNCKITVPHTEIQCLSDGGVGSQHHWTVCVAGQCSTNPTTSYLPPVIQNVSSDGGTHSMYTRGGTIVTISGGNFGPDGTTLSVTYGFTATEYIPRCKLVVPHTLIRCECFGGWGHSLMWKVSVGGQSTIPTMSITTSYGAPVIDSVSANAYSTKGGNMLTIRGRNFAVFAEDRLSCALAAARISLMFMHDPARFARFDHIAEAHGVLPHSCPRRTGEWDVVNFTLPPGYGSFSIALLVGDPKRQSMMKSSPVYLSYDIPTISSVEWSYDLMLDCTEDWCALDCFDTMPPDASFLCTEEDYAEDYECDLTCDKLSRRGFCDHPMMLHDRACEKSCGRCIRFGSYVLDIHGTNFGPAYDTLTREVIGEVSLWGELPHTCIKVTWNHTFIRCYLRNKVSSGTVEVTVGKVSSNIFALSNTASVTSTTAETGSAVQQLPPTDGRFTTLNIDGAGWGVGPLFVSVGGRSCNNLVYKTNTTTGGIIGIKCEMPQGEGVGVPVVVLHKSGYAVVSSTISFMPPTVAWDKTASVTDKYVTRTPSTSTYFKSGGHADEPIRCGTNGCELWICGFNLGVPTAQRLPSDPTTFLGVMHEGLAPQTNMVVVQNHTHMRISIPSGTGTQNMLMINVSGNILYKNLSYDPPNITSVDVGQVIMDNEHVLLCQELQALYPDNATASTRDCISREFKKVLLRGKNFGPDFVERLVVSPHWRISPRKLFVNGEECFVENGWWHGFNGCVSTWDDQCYRASQAHEILIGYCRQGLQRWSTFTTNISGQIGSYQSPYISLAKAVHVVGGASLELTGNHFYPIECPPYPAPKCPLTVQFIQEGSKNDCPILNASPTLIVCRPKKPFSVLANISVIAGGLQSNEVLQTTLSPTATPTQTPTPAPTANITIAPTPAPTFQPTFCGRGQFSLPGQGCVSCSSSSDITEAVKACKLCDPGQFEWYDATLGRMRCSQCPREYYLEFQTNPDAARKCKQCPVGKFQNQLGQAICQSTPPGVLVKQHLTNAEEAFYECPTSAMACERGMRSYKGGVWHSPELEFPRNNDVYVCATDGCPPQGALNMTCKKGYKSHSPMCSLCSDGYFLRLRSCTKCSSPRVLLLLGVVLVLTLLLCIGAFAYHKYSRFFHGVLPLFKIFVSFFTVVTTLETQFGIRWPDSVLEALSIFSAFSFDLGILSSVFCLFKVSYFHNLLFSTLLLIVVVAVAFMVAQYKPHLATATTKISMYLSLFAYPVVSVKIVEVFDCQMVNGISYLRADYSIECYSSNWWPSAAYAGLFLVLYVIGMPLFVITTLIGYSRRYKGAAPEGLLLGFLLDDYASTMPAMLWEGEEMGRKLLLSVLGALWPNQSPMAIATALVLSASFLGLHLSIQPYRSTNCNRLQMCCLIMLCFLYFGGLLLKGDMIQEDDAAIFLIFILVAPVLASTAAILLDIERQRRKQILFKPEFGVKMASVEQSLWLKGTDVVEHGLTSTKSLIAFVFNEEIASARVQQAKVQIFQVHNNDNNENKFVDINRRFLFTDFVGEKLRIIEPAHFAGGRVPVAVRGITIAQLKVFHRNFPGQTSREKQQQLMRECPRGQSYVEWQIGTPQYAQVMISYCWAMDWSVMIEFLTHKLTDDGVVWLDILACDQNAIKAGDMTEIEQLPVTIDFIGATYVMPGTLSRLWCIFEMAYSLVHNRHFEYYEPVVKGEAAILDSTKSLLAEDKAQLALCPEDLLAAAQCYKISDRNFILRLLDSHFPTRSDAANVIKLFIAQPHDHKQNTCAIDAATVRAVDHPALEPVENPLVSAAIQQHRKQTAQV